MAQMMKNANVVNTEVMADWLNEHLEKEMKLSALCRVEMNLTGRAGDTLNVPAYGYIGDAGEIEEGGEIPVVQLSAETKEIPIKKAGNGIKLTDEAVLSGYGDPLGEAAAQLTLSIAGKMDADLLGALGTIKGEMTHTDAENPISAGMVADALVLFGGRDCDKKALIVAPVQLAALRKSEDWVKMDDAEENGAAGMIHGCSVIVSDKIKASGGRYENFIVMPGALTLFLKKETEVETDRDILRKTAVVTADKYYAAYLSNPEKAVKIVCKA